MATSTFDRRLVITDPEAVIRLLTLEPATKPLSEHPITDEEIKRGEELIRACLARSKD